MTIEADIQTALKAHSGVAALVGTRVYGPRFPQNPEFPLVTVTRVAATREQAINDTIISTQPTYQVDAWDDDYHGCVALAIQLADCLSTMSGTTVTIGSRELLNDLDMYDPETGLYHRPLDVRVLTWTN